MLLGGTPDQANAALWPHVDESLTEVRAALALPTQAPSDAADGVYPELYEPLA